MNTFVNGSCISCFQPTDTVMATEGEAEWHMAFLMQFDMSDDEAIAIIRGDSPLGTVPVGRYEKVFRVCSECVSKASRGTSIGPALSLPGSPVPVFRQPAG